MRHVRDREVLAGAAAPVFPAICLGVLAMVASGVSPVIWGQQIAAWVIFSLLVLLLRRAAGRLSAWIWCALLLGVLAASLAGQSVGGAKRWVDLVVFHANAAQLVLPAMLVALSRVSCPYPMIMGAAVVLSRQPDFSQLMAFAAAASVILYRRAGEKMWKAGSVLVVVVCMVRCLMIPVEIEPVSYCEGILSMLAGRSSLLWLAGWVALALIPANWMHRYMGRKETFALGLAVYYAATMLFVLSGKYPVPFMGFGLSPIAGYAFACALCDADER